MPRYSHRLTTLSVDLSWWALWTVHTYAAPRPSGKPVHVGCSCWRACFMAHMNEVHTYILHTHAHFDYVAAVVVATKRDLGEAGANGAVHV